MSNRVTTREGQPLPPQQELHTLNMEAIRAAQKTNAAILLLIKEVLQRQHQMAKEQMGVSIGLKSFPSFEMTWLGVGCFASSDRQHSVLPSYLADEFINNGSLFPSFQNLKRPANLLSKCRIAVENSDDQAWLEKIWAGQDLVFYVYDSSIQECDEGDGACVKLVITTTDDELLIHFTGYPLEVGKRGPVKIHPRLSSLLTDEESGLLFCRIMHTFLRLHAYMLPSHIAVDLMEFHLEPSRPLTSKKYKEDYLDLQILRADFTLNLPVRLTEHGNDTDDDLATVIEDRLMEVGCALAALGRFEDAGPLYVEIGDTFKESVNSYFLAAQCFYNTGDYDAALESNAKHLDRLLRNDPDPQLDDPKYENPLSGILNCFHAKFEKALSGHDRNSRLLRFSQDMMEALGCLALFATANEKFRGFAPAFGIQEGTHIPSLLKSDFGRPARAKRALVKVMRSGSIEEYKKIFYKSIDRRKPLPLALFLDTSSSDAFRQKCAEHGRKSAHHINKNGYSPACSSCGSSERKLFVCPCKEARYCCKSCQLSHWKFHKKVCSFHLFNKEKKEKGGGRGKAETPK